MTHQFKFSKFLLLSLSVSTLALGACAGGSQKTAPKATANSMQPELKTTSIDRVMERALADAEANGNSQDVLAMLAQIHARNPKDPIVATRYGRALREDNQINAAVRTLTPFSKGANKSTEAVTEMAMTQLTLGDFPTAEKFANEAIEMDPKNARGFLALGTAQDAQSRHQEAEVSFRKGLKYWKGDPTPIMNNLALNLASQGHLQESLTLLEKALKISPNRMDLERNRRIIATLVETSGPRAPAPADKPKAIPKPSPAAQAALKKSEELSAEELNAKRVRENQAARAKVEQMKPAPAPKVVETKAPASTKTDERVLTQQEITAPRTSLKNLKMKTTDDYN